MQKLPTRINHWLPKRHAAFNAAKTKLWSYIIDQPHKSQ